MYVCKALYRVNEFEFSRLSQQYWWKLVGEVAVTMSSQPLLDRCECIYVCMYVCPHASIYIYLCLSVSVCIYECNFFKYLAVLINHTAPYLRIISLCTLIRFPPHLSEDSSFTRPNVPYSCGPNHDRCGPGTKRTPKSYC